MGFITLRAGVKSATLRAVVFNADGTVARDLGVIARASAPRPKEWGGLVASVKKWLRF